jgi:TPR repeat protein
VVAVSFAVLAFAAAAQGQVLTRTEVEGFERRAEAGDVAAMRALGDIYIGGDNGVAEDPLKAEKWLLAATEKGDADAAIFLATLYAEGRGPVAKDIARQRALLRKAADEGSVVALVRLAGSLTGDDPADRRFGEAAALLREAVDRGSADAAYRLGVQHYLGLGVRADRLETDRLMRLAAASGHDGAGRWLSDPAARAGKASEAGLAAAHALARRTIAASGVGTAFVDASETEEAVARHGASGLSCVIDPDNPRYALSVQGDGAACQDVGVRISAERAAAGASAETVLSAWAAELAAPERMKAVPAPPDARPGSRFPEAWLSDGDGFTRLSVAVIDGWTFRERLDSSEALWKQLARQEQSFSALDASVPLPKARPPVSPPPRPKPLKTLADGPQPTLDMIRAQVAACGAEQAFGEVFGETAPRGRARPRIGNSIFVYPDPAIPGVRELEVVVTDKTGLIHTVNASTPVYQDRAALSPALAAARAEALRLGWKETGGSGADEAFEFERPGQTLELSHGSGVFTVTCRDKALFARTMREFTGQERPLQRPVPPPELKPPPRYWAMDCSDTGLQAVILNLTLDESRRRYGAGAAWDRYWDQLASWKIGVIADKASLSKAQVDDLTLKSAVGGMEQGFTQALASLTEGVEGLIAMEKALDEGDERTACRNAVVWLYSTDAIVARNGTQWRAMHQYLDAEARRRGVSFD